MLGEVCMQRSLGEGRRHSVFQGIPESQSIQDMGHEGGERKLKWGYTRFQFSPRVLHIFPAQPKAWSLNPQQDQIQRRTPRLSLNRMESRRLDLPVRIHLRERVLYLSQWVMQEDSCNGFLPMHQFPKFPVDKCSFCAFMHV